MTNPNLAWFIACVCCFIFGRIASDTNDELELLGKFGIIAIAGSLVYCAVSYIIQ